MNKVIYDQQKLRAFLLGALSEDEAENFDELSFTDDAFADELSAAEKDLVDAYVRGELSGAELENFKNYYLASPRRRERVEFASAFQTFAGNEIVKTEKETVAEAAPKRGLARLFGTGNIFGGLRYALQFGFVAAALLFMILGGWLWTENRRLTEQASETQRRRDEISGREQQLQKQLETEQNQTAETANELARLREERVRLEDELNREKTLKEQVIAGQKKAEQRPPQQTLPNAPKQPSVQPRLSIASFILAPPLRGNDQIPNLSIPAKTDTVAAQLQLETDEFASYRVALVDQSNQTLWQSGKIKAQQAGTGKVLNVRIPARILKSQVYSLVVAGIGATSAAEEISSYPIRIVLD
jgi:uncharacterized protein YdcH (DUF465 family)